MLTNSFQIKRRLEREGWTLLRIKGWHHIFRNPKTGMIISLPHPGLGLGICQQNLPGRKLAKRLNPHMTHYFAIVEEEDGKPVGVWFPDLPGCVSAGDTLDEAMMNRPRLLKSGARR